MRELLKPRFKKETGFYILTMLPSIQEMRGGKGNAIEY
jgi:hypothetical protein